MKNAFIKIVEKIAKLIDLKSGVTMLLTVVFSILTLNGIISSEQFITIYTVIVSFYFGTQAGKRGSDNNESKNQ